MGMILREILRGTASSKAEDALGAADPAKVAEAMEKLDSGSFEEPIMESYYVERLVSARAVQAIPILKRRFAVTRDATAKDHIASALLRLGDRDDIYWDFLVAEVAPALETDCPSPVGNDSQRGPSDEFVAWAKSHNVATDSALKTLYLLATKVLLLAETEDPRAIPILRRALSTNYFLIQAYAAKGLAQMQDKESVPLIVGACKRAPAAAASAIAQSLVYFDDGQSTDAVDTYVPKDVANALRDARLAGRKPLR